MVKMKGAKMPKAIKVSSIIPARPKQIYEAWLNGKEHSAMTGGKARATDKVGSIFSAWDGYIKGKNLQLTKNKRIVQTWRSSDFTKDHLDSLLVVAFEETAKGTKVTITHSEIPDDQAAGYKGGWKEHYLDPMKKYFSQK